MTRWPYILLIVISIGLSFSPYLFFDFGFHNDFEIWAPDTSNWWNWFPETWHLIRIGRFLQAFLQNIFLSFFSTLESLAVARAIGVLFACLGAMILSSTLKRKGMDLLTSSIFSASVFLLPPAQVNLGWVANFIPGSLNAVLVLGAAALFPDYKMVLKRERKALLKIGSSIFLLFAALFIYPPTVGFFLLPALASIMFIGLAKVEERNLALCSLAFFGLVCSVYFLFHRLVFMKILNITFPASALYRFDVSHSLAGNFITFFKDIVPVMLNLWNPAPSATMIVVIFGTVLLLFGFCFRDRRFLNGGLLKNSRLGISIGLCLTFFLIMNAPGLLAAGRPPQFYRVWHPGTAAVLLVLFWLTSFLPQGLRKGVLGFYLLVGGLFAFSSSFHVAQTLSKQFKYAVEQIGAQFSATKLRYIIVEMRPKSLVFGKPRWGELGFIHVLSGGHVPYILDRFYDAKLRPTMETVVAVQNRNLLLLEPELIDPLLWTFNVKSEIGSPETVEVTGVATASAQSAPPFRLLRALDNIYYTFWETDDSFPIAVDFKLKEQKTIQCYAFQAGDDSLHSRMPRSWTFFGSHDGIKWIVLDARTNEANWTDNGRRIYSLSSAEPYLHYRIEFHSVNGDRHLRIYELDLSEDLGCNENIP